MPLLPKLITHGSLIIRRRNNNLVQREIQEIENVGSSWTIKTVNNIRNKNESTSLIRSITRNPHSNPTRVSRRFHVNTVYTLHLRVYGDQPWRRIREHRGTYEENRTELSSHRGDGRELETRWYATEVSFAYTWR